MNKNIPGLGPQKKYCKSGNIRGTLIFAYFAQIQQARIQKPAKIFAVPK